PKPRDDGLFSEAELPRPPSFNERDVSDKPSFVQERARLDRDEKRKLEHRYRCTLESLQEVDRGVGDIYRALETVGEADNTLFVFTSDNGFFFGEHRLVGKSVPYEEALRVPFAVRLPRSLEVVTEQTRRVHKPVANVDLVPTILELAGADPCLPDGNCRTLDGRSLTPLMRGEPGWPEDRAILLESRRNDLDAEACRYSGLRTSQTVYVEHESVFDRRKGTCEQASEIERYDLQDDPFELQNLSPAETSTGGHNERELSRRLEALTTCAGIAGRDPDGAGAFCE
ncbi:MAG: sulfatase-like hydrolase/transferase, partial [Actinomycetota bacterium]|nr:sulfatase-like hydrolase/transferase [Actinomycetota bacterium]